MMNPIARWNPSQQLAAAREPMYRLFDTFFSNGGEDLASRTWTPPVDIQETDDSYRIHAELPGLTKDDIQITLENNVLRLSGERKFEKDVKEENYHRIERTYGTFSRSFALPTLVSSDKVEAKFENGVLSILVPKAEQAKPRHIAIA
jgi:HSP20 family protein